MNIVPNFRDERQSVIKVKDQADILLELNSKDEFLVNLILFIKTKKGRNINISIFLK